MEIWACVACDERQTGMAVSSGGALDSDNENAKPRGLHSKPTMSITLSVIRIIAPRFLPDGGRAGTGGRDFVYADSSKSARVK